MASVPDETAAPVAGAGTGAAPAIGTVGIETVRELSGLALLEGIRDGRLPAPPMPTVLGFRLVAVSEGFARFQGSPSADHLNPLGTVHGGWYAAILDSALGCAVHATCPAGTLYTTLEFKLNLVRPLPTDGGVLTCEGVVRHRGGRTATSEANLTDARGRLFAHASGTCLIMPLPS